MKKFTDAELRDSLFYPACGTDLRPVRMMADGVQTFVCTDWNRSEDEVARAFREEAPDNLQLVASSPVGQELYGRACLQAICNNPRSKRYGEYVMGDADCLQVNEILPAGFQLTESEVAAYDRRRRTVTAVLRPWAREFVFDYRGQNGTRRLKLLYFSDEGLARYCVLYGRRGLAPRFICTIQSGPGFGHGWTMLEEPGGRFEEFLLAWHPRPTVWIRKAWHDKRQPGHWNRRLARYSFGRIKAFIHDETSRTEMHQPEPAPLPSRSNRAKVQIRMANSSSS